MKIGGVSFPLQPMCSFSNLFEVVLVEGFGLLLLLQR